MGRIYDRYCHRCQRSTARSDDLSAGHELFQCQFCGTCWYEVKEVRKLNTHGTNEGTWKLAMREAYDDMDKRVEQ